MKKLDWLHLSASLYVKFCDENVFQEEIMHEHYAGKRVARFFEWEEFLILEFSFVDIISSKA